MSWSDESGQDLVHYFKENAQGSAMPVGMKSSGSSAKLDQVRGMCVGPLCSHMRVAMSTARCP